MDPSTLSVAELKSAIVRLEKSARKRIGPYLYYLRKELKAQGRKGEGFGAWVTANLEITRRTADLWADAYEREIGKRPPKSQPLENGSKGSRLRLRRGVVPPEGIVSLQIELSAEKQVEFKQALEIVRDRVHEVVYQAVMKAAATAKKPNVSETAKTKTHTTPARHRSAHA